MINPAFFHHSAAALAIGLGSIGGGIGQGFAGFAGLQAMQRQPAANSSIFRSIVIGLALIESGIIIAFITALILMFSPAPLDIGAGIAELGIALLIGITATAVSSASAFTVQASANSIARQPLFADKINTMMLLSLSLLEAPIIFSFIVALLVRNTMTNTMSIAHGVQSLAACLATLLGGIGPSIGLGIFAQSACSAIGLNTKSYKKIFPFAIFNEAVIETPLIFSIIISIMILYHPIAAENIASSYIFVAAAIAVGTSAIGTSSGIGYATSRSALQIGLNPDAVYNAIFKASLLISAFIESSVIYGTVVAFLLIGRA